MCIVLDFRARHSLGIRRPAASLGETRCCVWGCLMGQERVLTFDRAIRHDTERFVGFLDNDATDVHVRRL